MGSALRQAPSPICGVRPNPQLLLSWEQASPGLDVGEDTSATPLCRRVFFATLLTTWSPLPLRAERCLLCSMKTPALAGTGRPGRCHTPTGALGWSLVGVRVPTPPNLSAQGLLPPLHPNVPGDIPSLKTTLKFSHGLSTSAACPALLCHTVCGVMAVFPTQDRSLLDTAQNHPTPIMDP